ncbi:probable E3 SUMO-protein ligase RNF212 isoform X1 [Lampris incognitus]|uniref:probable E3 SUMO-protein ligase RNF212 isoform X1 n=1 Tax=Lampris incognitus TaxID=2546036 RepID=UPI0024B613A1|nr:probable E3 SUMO-protein ligase RNF212 isoform X1 [Lampris incognitus]
MSYWVRCNYCFQSPGADLKLALTSCGHLICHVCFPRGKQGECLICNAKCQVSPLTDKSNSEVKALFSDISTVATKYFSEISKVIVFQARHQKRLLTHYQQRNEKLEEALMKKKQEVQQIAKKLSEQSAHFTKLQNSLLYQSSNASSVPQMSLTSCIPHGGKSVRHSPYGSPMPLQRHSSTSNLDKNLEVDGKNLFKKPDSRPRLSLISPPQNGQMGSVTHRFANQNTGNHSMHSATVSRFQGASTSSDVSYGRSSGWVSPVFKLPTSYRHSS